jgi:hypothetical protein
MIAVITLADLGVRRLNRALRQAVTDAKYGGQNSVIPLKVIAWACCADLRPTPA